MASEKIRSRFRESVGDAPSSPTADSSAHGRRFAGSHGSEYYSHSPLPERPSKTHRGSRSEYSSVSPSPAAAMFANLECETPEVRDPTLLSKYLARRATLLGWFDEPAAASIISGSSSTCVAVQRADGTYAFSPDDPSPALAAVVARLDEAAIMSMSSELTISVIAAIDPGQRSLTIESAGVRIPVVQTLNDVHPLLVHSTRSCVVLHEKCVLIWSNEPGTLINAAHKVEKQLLGFVVGPNMPRGFMAQTEEQSVEDTHTPIRGALDEKNEVYMRAVALEEGHNGDEGDVEGTAVVRPTLRMHSFRIALVMILICVTMSIGVSKLLRQYFWDGGYLRFCLVATIPPLALFALFFFIVVVGSVFQLFLPVGMVMRNSKYHSAVKPNPKRHVNYELPHITVQMPVYKEGLKGVIVPTMVSVMAAIQHYEDQGGTASVFVNDDGMQCIQPELAEARRQYYREQDIGYCARLPTAKTGSSKKGGSWWRRSAHNDPEVDNQDDSALSPQGRANRLGFVRKGKFKKASNMNYCLAFSNRIEDELQRLTELECQERGCVYNDLTPEDDDELYDMALQNMLAEDDGKTWAEGNVRIGELILIIDCDTRVPVDCLLYGALEMHESPEVAILQHGSGVMQVAHNVFENGITYFTNVVYTAIKYGVGTGDVAPFVGHNAFLRWKAIQSVQFVDPADGQTKWWSDSHVSEDFDISLRTQMAGMIARLATYHNGAFQEGVSLTVYDELNRWEKYAYGCDELVFHPLYQWIYKGPVTRLFWRFLWSNMPVSSKVSIIAYIFTYYAIAAGIFLTAGNYFLMGLFPDDVDHFYTPSFGTWCSILVVFQGISAVAISLARHRLKEQSFWISIIETIKWLPFMVVFFGGISLNCAKALFCHAFSINIEWASTAKELGPTGIYVGLNKMVHRFIYVWLICIAMAGVMIYMAVAAPWGWNITPGPNSTGTIALVPLSIQVGCTFFLPLFLGLT